MTPELSGRRSRGAGGPALYELVGGHEALAAAVAVFYQRVLADPELRPWFDGVDISRLRSHQRAFLAGALGGPDLFAGRDLGAAHRGLRVTDRAFDSVLDHLACTLRDLGVNTIVVARIGEHVEALRPQIVERELGGSVSE
jgi:hemoglobin